MIEDYQQQLGFKTGKGLVFSGVHLIGNITGMLTKHGWKNWWRNEQTNWKRRALSLKG
jgi:hypothetical protein